MSSSINVGNWRKQQVLLRVFICLCMLLIGFIFVPDLDKFPDSASAPYSMANNSQNYAWLPATFTFSTNPYKVNRTEDNTYRKALALHDTLALALSSKHFISNLRGVSYCLSSCDSIFKRDLQQACQLLDIPPPSI